MLVAAALLAGCAHAKGEAGKPPAQVIADAKRAIAKATTMHIAGGIASARIAFSLDSSFGPGQRAAGKITISSLKISYVRIGGTLYIRGNSDFWKHTGGKQAAALLKGKWVKTSAERAPAEFVRFLSPEALFQRLVSSFGTLGNVGRTTYQGHRVIKLADGNGDSVYVAATGTHYPVSIVDPNPSSGGAFNFGRWNKPTSIRPPRHAVDVSRLRGAGPTL